MKITDKNIFQGKHQNALKELLYLFEVKIVPTQQAFGSKFVSQGLSKIVLDLYLKYSGYFLLKNLLNAKFLKFYNAL